MIGRFGDLRFQVNARKTLTFKEMKVSRGMKTAEHAVPWYKGRLEVTGEELDEVTMTIILRADLGIRPRRQAERIRQFMHQKIAHYLVIGGKMVMDRRCIITKMNESWNEIYRGGEVAEIEITVTFKEYN